MSEPTQGAPRPVPAIPEPASNVDWFRRSPNGGTAYVPPRPANSEVHFFRRAPNGGGTVFALPRNVDDESETADESPGK